MVRIEVLISDESGLKWCEQPRDCEFGIFFFFFYSPLGSTSLSGF